MYCDLFHYTTALVVSVKYNANKQDAEKKA